jgi:hypothetical protein
MRPGGEADKLGNRYEGFWTIYNLLDLLRGTATEVVVEPMTDGLGVEFVKSLPGGIREFHSVKIRTTKNYWGFDKLLEKSTTGRSILGDLIDKLRSDPKAEAKFISETGANPLTVICDDAHAASDVATFLQRLSQDRQTNYSKHILPMCASGDAEAFDLLRRLETVSGSSSLLQDTIEHKIALSIRSVDGKSFPPEAVRRLFADVILDNLAKPITRQTLLDRLEAEGYREANWARDLQILARVEYQNDAYRRSVRGQLINNKTIRRQEANDAFNVILRGTHRCGAFVGIAGLGKSCTSAELLDYLKEAGMPHLAIRLDEVFDANSPKQLGELLDLVLSPVDVLAEIAEANPCALILDQLDALSLISGRNSKQWRLIKEPLSQAKAYPNMRIWLSCRAFDLENDYRLRGLFEREKAHRVDLRLLTPDEVRREIADAKVNPAGLGSQQIELLRTPMHLSLYLEGDPANKPPFKTVQDLYDQYWDRKQDLVKERLGRSPKWTEVISLLADKLSEDQTLTVPVDYLDMLYRDDARMMASENVLGCENGVYRFFHEGFFDYAFARLFVARGRKLAHLLLTGGEQHFFRRAQVRQVLSYLRGHNFPMYLEELRSVLYTPGIRAHIVKLVLDWLRAVPEPTSEELEILCIS